jgi:predicted permease
MNSGDHRRVYSSVDPLLTDVRFAFRAVLRRPGFSLLAIVTLAIGIGVNAVAFSAINGVLLKPRRFAGAQELGWIMTKAPGNAYGSMSLPDFQDFTRETRAFDAIAAEGRMALSMRTDGGGAERVWAMLVSAEYLTMLRVQPRIGRVFTAADLTGLPAVVSERFWKERLGGGASPAGRTLTFNGRAFEIVGVLPDGFQGPGGLFEPSVWLPLEQLDVLNLSPALRTRGQAWLTVVGRMKQGVTSVQAEGELQAIAQQLAAAFPDTNKERGVTFTPVLDGHPQLRGAAPIAWIALGVVSIVLLMACFNVAGLLLARAAERQREISVRAALGATRARILRQLVAEGLLLAGLSGAAAILVATWSSGLLAAFSLPAPIPQRLHLPVDLRLVGFTAAMALVAGVLPALLPALQATRANLVGTLKMESAIGGRRSRARDLFVIAQIAGSTFFLAASLLFVRSYWTVAAYDPAFDAVRSLTVEVDPAAYGYDTARARTFFEAAVERLEALPGVTHAAIADRAPFFVGFPKTSEVPGEGEDCSVVRCRTFTYTSVGKGVFQALGLELVAGREFTDQEIRSGSQAVVGVTMAAALWPEGGAVGQWFRDGRDGVQRQVVGVVADIRHPTAPLGTTPAFYRPLRVEEFSDRLTIVIRTSDDPRLAIAPILQQLQALDANLPADVRTMKQRMEIPLWPSRTAAGLFSVCGALALALATVGLFGVTYRAVRQRTREFGVRVALGATPGRLIALVLRDGLMLTLPGVAAGIVAALLGAHVLANALVGISPADPLTYGMTALIQALVALAACALPAYMATAADPVIALRQE